MAQLWKRTILLLLLMFVGVFARDNDDYKPRKFMYKALIRLAYQNSTDIREMGRFGGTYLNDAEGIVVHVQSGDKNGHDGCTPFHNPIPKEKWIALIERGDCDFEVKIKNAQVLNASAVVIYNHSDEKQLVSMRHQG